MKIFVFFFSFGTGLKGTFGTQVQTIPSVEFQIGQRLLNGSKEQRKQLRLMLNTFLKPQSDENHGVNQRRRLNKYIHNNRSGK